MKWEFAAFTAVQDRYLHGEIRSVPAAATYISSSTTPFSGSSPSCVFYSLEIQQLYYLNKPSGHQSYLSEGLPKACVSTRLLPRHDCILMTSLLLEE
jgi:hypothetical protein